MAHVELSLSEALVAPVARPKPEPPPTAAPAQPESGVRRWAPAVEAATEACLLIDAQTRIVATSAECRRLLGLADPVLVAGRPLLKTLQLIDFTARPNPLDETDADKIPPLLALNSKRLARGLLRVGPVGGEAVGTVDAITTPVLAGEAVVGSLTFLSAI